MWSAQWPEFPEADELHVDEHRERERDGDVEAGGRRVHERDQAEQVHGHDVDEQCAQERQETRRVLGAQDAGDEVGQQLDHHLDTVLEAARDHLRVAARGERDPDQDQSDEKREHKDLVVLEEVAPRGVREHAVQHGDDVREAVRA
jgi:hypothetical protein